MVRKPRSPLRGPWEGWEAGSRSLWPQTYKSKRGASAGRGAAGRVGEAGPFLLGKSRRVSVNGRGRVGTVTEICGQPGRTRVDSPSQ